MSVEIQARGMKRATKKNAAGNGGLAARRKASQRQSLEELKKEVAAMSPLMARIFEISASLDFHGEVLA